MNFSIQKYICQDCSEIPQTWICKKHFRDFYHSGEAGAGPRGQKGEEEASHKEAAERLHVVHEGDAAEGGGGVHAERERGNQPNFRTKGECLVNSRLNLKLVVFTVARSFAGRTGKIL